MRSVAGEREFWTPLGVRLRLACRRPGRPSWLFFPGGPGVGSESLVDLVELVALPGASWLVDLPGDGSNVDPPGAPRAPYHLWPDVLLEAVDAVPDPVVVGHGAGGQHLLSVPSLEQRVAGLALISSAPDAGWLATSRTLAQRHPLPGYAETAQRYECNPTPHNMRELAVISAAWQFGPAALQTGRELFSRLPWNPTAAEWSAQFFDPGYVASWFPQDVPTLIVSGSDDQVVDQRLWDDPYYRGSRVRRVLLEGGSHWPWLDEPRAVAAAFAELARRVTSRLP